MHIRHWSRFVGINGTDERLTAHSSESDCISLIVVRRCGTLITAGSGTKGTHCLKSARRENQCRQEVKRNSIHYDPLGSTVAAVNETSVEIGLVSGTRTKSRNGTVPFCCRIHCDTGKLPGWSSIIFTEQPNSSTNNKPRPQQSAGERRL